MEYAHYKFIIVNARSDFVSSESSISVQGKKYCVKPNMGRSSVVSLIISCQLADTLHI